MKKIFLLSLIFLLALCLPSFAKTHSYHGFTENEIRNGILSVGYNNYDFTTIPKSSSMEFKNGIVYVTQKFEDLCIAGKAEAVYSYTTLEDAVVRDIEIRGDDGTVIEVQRYEVLKCSMNNFSIFFQFENTRNITLSFSLYVCGKSFDGYGETVKPFENNIVMEHPKPNAPIVIDKPKPEVSLNLKIAVFFIIFTCLYVLSKLRDYFNTKAYFEKHNTRF